MNKRLIHFRGTDDFARVEIKKTGKKLKKVSVAWASCITSIKEINKPEFTDFGDAPANTEEAIFNIVSEFGTLHGDVITPTRIFFKQPCLPEYQNKEKA